MTIYFNVNILGKSTWNNWNKSSRSKITKTIQNRKVVKSKKAQLVGLLGPSERKDFYNTFNYSLGLRYHFRENISAEIIKLNISSATISDTAQDLANKTNSTLDVVQSNIQLSSAFIYSPIYGKYAWNDDKVIHFDLYSLIGVGVRFSDDDMLSPFVQAGLGMNHFFGGMAQYSIVGEFRIRNYSEQRVTEVSVLESLFQIGFSWLL